MTISRVIKLELLNQDNLQAPDSDQFQLWLNQVAKKCNTSGEICLKIISLEESQYLNNIYRGKDRPTNVLSFPADYPDFIESDHLGDLAICAQLVEQEANDQNKNLKDHWAHLIIHGYLHLLGYDHIEESEAETMEALEIEVLAELGITNPYV